MSKSTRNQVKLPVHAFPRNDVGLVVVPGENKVPQAPLILKDRIMKSDRVKVPLLSPEHLLCFLRDAGGGQDTLIRGAGCVI